LAGSEMVRTAGLPMPGSAKTGVEKIIFSDFAAILKLSLTIPTASRTPSSM
jgi:hypothetical protein